MKIGSLFDGSGGFPLAATLCGGQAVWAAEIEPYPIAVTRSRFPEMIHLGDVSKIRGDQIEPVDVITFGSPCQDLSVAGKRAGLKHTENGDDETTRSGLFMEAVRIIREMREATNGNYPKYALWENVPGAFSSNKGEDFRIVLEELIKIVEPTAIVPPVPKNGWAYADYFCGDGWSLAWRVLDAQYIRTAQRRRRIYLVLDLTAERAREILFERESLRGYSAEIGTPWKEPARDVGSCAETADRARERLILDDLVDIVSAGFKANQGAKAGGIGWEEEKACTLNADRPGLEPSVCVKCYESHPMDSRIKELEDDVSPTVSVKWHKGAADTPLVCEQHLFENHSQDSRYRGPLEVCPMLPAQLGTGGNNQPFVVEKSYSLQGNTIDRDAKQNGGGISEDVAHTLNAVDRHGVVYCMATQQGGAEIMENLCPTITASAGMSGNNQPVLCMAHGQANAEILEEKSPCLNCNHEQPIVFDKEVYQSGVNATGGHYISEGGPAPTLRTTGQPPGVCVHYIVRRLTPTECARLQGFPDRWGNIDPKEDFTDEEYRFWLEVRNTHAAINGKAVKDYTHKQMLTWYNKLHTDSAEYKMWGNGIALPCALYVMQGIQDALEVDNGSVA